MNKVLPRSLLAVLLVSFWVAPLNVFAQGATIDADTLTSSEEAEEAEPVLTAVITSNNQVEVSRNIIFDGGNSINPSGRLLTYRWNFGDGTTDFGSEVVHTYNKPGTYEVVLNVSDGIGQDTAMKSIVVYDRLLLLFVDHTTDTNVSDSVATLAQTQGHFVRVLGSFDNQSDYLTAQNLIKEFSNNINDVRSANIIIIWTGGSASLGAISDFAKSVASIAPVDFSQKTIVYVTNSSLGVMQRIAQSTFRSVKPARIVLTRPAALHLLLDIVEPDEIAQKLSTSGVDFKIVNEVTGRVGPLNILSYLVDFMRNKGVPDNTIFLIFMLPVIATVIAFIRQVIGISTAGIYAPAIITISLIAMGLWTGILVFILILFVSNTARLLVRKYNIMYIPRMAIVLTLTTLGIFVLLLGGSFFELESITSIPIFPLLILIAMAEKFMSIVIERGTKASFLLMGETLLVAVICYMLVNQWGAFQTFMLAYPEMIFVLLIINVLLGRWTGLRLTEYLRFHTVLTSVEHAEEEE